MENASNALIMAASVLIGIMVLSMGVYLFTQFSGTSERISEKLAESQLNQFNAQFTNYESNVDKTGNLVKNCTAHDIVTVANMAKQNNSEFFTEDEINSGTAQTDGSYYVQVDTTSLKSCNSDYRKEYFERLDESDYQEFIKKYSLENGTINIMKFYCTIEISDITHRVNKIIFYED